MRCSDEEFVTITEVTEEVTDREASNWPPALPDPPAIPPLPSTPPASPSPPPLVPAPQQPLQCVILADGRHACISIPVRCASPPSRYAIYEDQCTRDPARQGGASFSDADMQRRIVRIYGSPICTVSGRHPVSGVGVQNAVGPPPTSCDIS